MTGLRRVAGGLVLQGVWAAVRAAANADVPAARDRRSPYLATGAALTVTLFAVDAWFFPPHREEP